MRTHGYIAEVEPGRWIGRHGFTRDLQHAKVYPTRRGAETASGMRGRFPDARIAAVELRELLPQSDEKREALADPQPGTAGDWETFLSTKGWAPAKTPEVKP